MKSLTQLKKRMKRLFDFSASLLFSTIFLPFWIFIAFIIKVDSPGPIFFRQDRIGLRGDSFKIFKFRTMIVDAEKKGLQLTVGEKDPRITKVGYILRISKLDELPQLFNIVLGQMSFVGPRPEVPQYVKRYTAEQRKVLDVLPGITDIASIKYINENELLRKAPDPEEMYVNKIMQEKLRLNLEYLSRRSFLSDIKIILKTIFKIIL